MILVEAVPEEVAGEIVSGSSVPTIGIGAGTPPHGQILVLQDLLGMTHWQPGFATPVAQVGNEIRKAAREWVDRVSRREITDHRYRMKMGEAARLKA